MTATQPRLVGFRPFLRKELTEWWQRRAALITFVIVAALATLGTLAARIDLAGGDTPDPGMLDATVSILGSKLDQWVTMAAIFASIGLLTHERATGTLGWTLSKPISRSSLLLAKWTAAVLTLALCSVILPLTWMVAVATFAYGSVPDLAAVARFGGLLIALPALFVALELALATRLDSQAGIAATALAVAFAPYLIASFLPSLVELWPSAIAGVATAVALAEPVNLSTVASWALTIAVVAVLGLWTFNREDL
jgi:ABC-type transport system involved in multi-copper enzyme maturation permease subunit